MTTNTEREPFVDAIEAGKFLSLRPRRVLELARQGLIPAYPLGNGQRRVWRFRLSELASAICSRGVHCDNAAVRAKEKN
jgi:Helix-turn-helix domain